MVKQAPQYIFSPQNAMTSPARLLKQPSQNSGYLAKGTQQIKVFIEENCWPQWEQWSLWNFACDTFPLPASSLCAPMETSGTFCPDLQPHSKASFPAWCW